MRYLFFGVVAGALWVAVPAMATDATHAEKCEDWRGQRFSLEERIDGCAATIKSGHYQGKELARIYVNSGMAWHDRGDNDRAIADYDQAIKLDPINAKAYDNRGNARKAKGQSDLAVADFDQAIKLDPNNAIAYFNRGSIWDDRGDDDRALADYDQAIKLKPDYAKAYNNRGLIREAKGDLALAIADLDQAIRARPNDFQPYFGRGRIELTTGAWPKALVDLTRAAELNPEDAYSALWLEILVKRNELPSRLADAARQIDMKSWPAPVIRLYLGQLAPEATLAAANDPDAETRKGQVCETNFYVGEAALQRGDKDEAKRLFQRAVAGCPKGFIEATSANAELKALGVGP